jgi:hypothetical protein
MSFGPTDFGNYVRLRNLLDGFQKRALNYCSSPDDAQVRSTRVDEIFDALTGDGELPPEVNLATGCPNCGVDEHCEGGACVPNTAYLSPPAGNAQQIEDV